MIKPQVSQMRRELYECSMAPGQEAICARIDKWWRKWVKELHAGHSFSREIVDHYKNDKGYIEHAHKNMHFSLADLIRKEKWSVLETEYNVDDDGRINPFIREDRLSIYLLGEK